MSLNKVHQCDCFEFMKQLPDNAYDFVIADPWYGVGMTNDDTTGFAKRRFRLIEKNIGHIALKGFDDSAPPKEHFDEMRRISKNQIIWGGNYFLDWLGNCPAPYIWDKGTGANYFADGEMAWTSFKRGCLRIFTHQWCGCFKASERGEKLIHPCQKPVAVYVDLIKRYVPEKASIFSPYVGSGADRIAAYILDRPFEGCEIVESFWTDQEQRFMKFVVEENTKFITEKDIQKKKRDKSLKFDMWR